MDRRQPPLCRPGQFIGPPDYVGLGAQKSGTSWWHRLIQSHPAVHRSRGLAKEVHFFDSRTPPFNPSPRRMAERYAEYFPRPPGMIVGEWTPRYLHDYWVPPLLGQAAPEARLLVILRDPVERFRSGLTLSLRLSEGANRKLLVNEAFSRGLYWAQLGRWFSCVDPCRVLILQYERCVADTAGELRRTFEFLGIDDDHRPVNPRGYVNQTVGGKIELSLRHRQWLNELYRDDIETLAANVTGIDPALWGNPRSEAL